MYDMSAKQASAPRGAGQVSVHLEKLAALVEEAMKLQHELEARLVPVVRPEPPTGSGEIGKIGEVLVPMADMLGQRTNVLSDLVDRQRNLLQRLEL